MLTKIVECIKICILFIIAQHTLKPLKLQCCTQMLRQVCPKGRPLCRGKSVFPTTNRVSRGNEPSLLRLRPLSRLLALSLRREKAGKEICIRFSRLFKMVVDDQDKKLGRSLEDVVVDLSSSSTSQATSEMTSENIKGKANTFLIFSSSKLVSISPLGNIKSNYEDFLHGFLYYGNTFETNKKESAR